MEEIRFPTPPWRAIPEDAKQRISKQKRYFEPLSLKKLTVDEAFDRFDRVGEFIEEQAAFKNLAGMPTIADELFEVCIDYALDTEILEEDEVDSLLKMIFPLLVCLFGWGHGRGYEWDPELVVMEIERQIDRFGDCAESNDEDFAKILDRYLESSGQPGVLRAFAVVMADFHREFANESKLSMGFSFPLASAFIDLAMSTLTSSSLD